MSISLTFYTRGSSCHLAELFLYIQCSYMLMSHCHKPFQCGTAIACSRQTGKVRFILWVLERIVDIILGSDVLSHYGSEMVPSVKLPYSRPEMTMVANHPFWERQKLRKTGMKKGKYFLSLILAWGRDEGCVTLRSSSMDWYCIWPLGSCNPVSLKANL